MSWVVILTNDFGEQVIKIFGVLLRFGFESEAVDSYAGPWDVVIISVAGITGRISDVGFQYRYVIHCFFFIYIIWGSAYEVPRWVEFAVEVLLTLGGVTRISLWFEPGFNFDTGSDAVEMKVTKNANTMMESILKSPLAI